MEGLDAVKDCPHGRISHKEESPGRITCMEYGFWGYFAKFMAVTHFYTDLFNMDNFFPALIRQV